MYTGQEGAIEDSRAEKKLNESFITHYDAPSASIWKQAVGWIGQQRASHQGHLCYMLVIAQEREKGLDLDGGHGLERKKNILESLQRFLQDDLSYIWRAKMMKKSRCL